MSVNVSKLCGKMLPSKSVHRGHSFLLCEELGSDLAGRTASLNVRGWEDAKLSGGLPVAPSGCGLHTNGEVGPECIMMTESKRSIQRGRGGDVGKRFCMIAAGCVSSA